MNSPADPRPAFADVTVTHPLYHRTRLSWPAIFGGLVAAMALQVLFMLLGAGLGFAIYNPITSENPVENLGTGAVVIHGLSAVFSLWFGGWIAGRFTPVASRSSGWLHGFLVWCAATVAGVIVVSTSAGWILGDLSKLVGGGLSAAGKPVAAAVSGATDLAKDAAKNNNDLFGSFVSEATADQPSNAPRAASVRAKREISLAVARLFNPLQKEKMADNKAALVKTLTDDAGMKQPDAERLVNDWTDSYNRLRSDLEAAKADAEAKAKVAAEKAANVLAVFSLGTFVAFILGALSAACGGGHGAKCARKHDVIVEL
jgi:hypothetical protein